MSEVAAPEAVAPATPAAPAPAAAPTAAAPAPAPVAAAPAAPAAPAPAAAPAPVVPADYTFQLPEGVVLDEQTITEMKQALRASNATQEQAQAQVASIAQAHKTLSDRAVARELAAGVTALKADPEFGGENFERTLADAKATVQAIGGDELLAELDRTGLGRSPVLVKAFARLAKSGAVRGSFVAGGNARNGGERSAADILYG